MSENTFPSKLRAGASSVDITPENGRTFQGYVRPDISARGVSQRLQTNVLVLKNEDRKLAIVSSDLVWGFAKDELLDRVRNLGFDRHTLLQAGTHTHAGRFAGSWAIKRMAQALEEADQRKVPARAGWSEISVDEVNQNRALEAHLANHGQDHPPGTAQPSMDPEGEDHSRDTTLRLLRVENSSGNPLAALWSFSVHPTAYTPHNRLYSPDIVGMARHHFQKSFPDGTEPPVIFLNGTEGDLITNYDDYNQFALANSLGKQLARGMNEAWNQSENLLNRQMDLAGDSRTVRYDGQEVEPGRTVGERALFGFPFLGGAKNGPSFLYLFGTEGRRRPRSLADDVQGRKIVVSPAPWSPEVEVQSLRIGNRRLLTVPGEPSLQMGRRVVDEVMENTKDNLEDAFIVGLANGYHGYFTTHEEYERQHYEGGHTVFGKYTEALIRKTHVELLQEEAEPDPPTGDSLEEAPETTPTSTHSPVERISTGMLLENPPDAVERYNVVDVLWEGEGAGRERPLDNPFIYLDRRTKGGWKQVQTDLEPGLIWFVRDGRYRARFDVPGDLPTGFYRFRIDGTGYVICTNPFRVDPCSRLRIRGVRPGQDDSSLRFLVQNPPPDPQRNLRPRATVPPEGTLSFDVAGSEYNADWDEEIGAYRNESYPLSSGDLLTVPKGEFTDQHGNYNGQTFREPVGSMDELDWPRNMETGGGSPPGLFGYGVSTVPEA